jgi:asparagine synthase (glutamine-hydrolysing)
VGICAELQKARQIEHYTPHGFGYVPPSGEHSEERYMRVVASEAGAQLTVVQPKHDEFQSALVRIVRDQQEPFGSLSIAAQWFVFQAARRAGIKVMLDGQGADEVFAGYHSYLFVRAAQLLQRGRVLEYLSHAYAHKRYYGKPLITVSDLMRATRVSRFLPPARSPNGGAGAPAAGRLLAGDLAAVDERTPRQPHDVQTLLADQTSATSLPSLLRFEDRNSMAHSIEGRVPYLDHRVVEFAFSLPPESKLTAVQPKDVLRRALADVLPSEVKARRDKIGFRADASATHRFAADHYQALREARTEWERDWLSHDVVDELLRSQDRSDAAEFALWRLINLKLWLRNNWAPERDPLDPQQSSRAQLSVT